MASELLRKLSLLSMQRKNRGGHVDSDLKVETSDIRNFGVHLEGSPAHRPSSSAHGSEGRVGYSVEQLQHRSSDPNASKGRPSLPSDSDDWSHASTTECSLHSSPVVVAKPWGSLDKIKIEMRYSCDKQDGIIPALCKVLEEILNWNEKDKTESRSGHEAHNSESPTEYIKRIMKLGCCGSSCSVIVGLLYLDRLKSVKYPNLRLTYRNYRTLLLVAIMTANKFLEDNGCTNAQWAALSGLSLKCLNELELDFLFSIHFYLQVQPEEYRSFLTHVLSARRVNDTEEFTCSTGSESHSDDD